MGIVGNAITVSPWDAAIACWDSQVVSARSADAQRASLTARVVGPKADSVK